MDFFSDTGVIDHDATDHAIEPTRPDREPGRAYRACAIVEGATPYEAVMNGIRLQASGSAPRSIGS